MTSRAGPAIRPLSLLLIARPSTINLLCCCAVVFVGFKRQSGLTQQPRGVMGIKTYGRVGLNKENLFVCHLDDRNGLKDSKNINVLKNG